MNENLNLLAVDRLGAERSVIGSMLIDDRCIKTVMAELPAADLADGPCRNTYQAIRRLIQEGKPVDPILVQEAVGGGADWVRWARDLMEATPTAANVLEYVRIVRECAQYHRLRDGASKVLDCCTLAEARQAAQTLAGNTASGRLKRERSGRALAAAFHARMTGPTPKYLRWGIPKMDNRYRAEPGDYIVIGGFPSAGKTMLAIQFALHQAKEERVGFYSLETRDDKVTDRIISHLSGVELNRIKSRRLSSDDWPKVGEAEVLFSERLHLDVIECFNATAEDIVTDAEINEYSVIYVDYLQNVRGEGTDFEKVSEASLAFKRFAARSRTTVVALASLSRAEKSKGKNGTTMLSKPTMQSFKSSGQIEYDADSAFLLWESVPDDYTSPRVLCLAKNKEGERFSTMLAFDGPRQRMVEMEEDPDMTVANELAAKGRAAKAQNRAAAQNNQVTFQELPVNNEENPFTSQGVGA